MNKKALILGGGGGKGSYQIGAWKALKEYNIDDDIEIFSGASIGAINAVLIQVATVEEVTKIWLNTEIEEIIEPEQRINNRSIRKLSNSIEKLGYFSRRGLIRKFEELNVEEIRNSSKSTLVSIVDISDTPEEDREMNAIRSWMKGRKFGVTKYVNLKKVNRRNIYRILLASSAIPIVFNPVLIDGRLYIDGGINEKFPIKPIYHNGYKDIIIVPCERVNKTRLQRRYPKANINIVQPTRSLGNLWKGTLNFSSEKIKANMEQGYYDTKLAIDRYWKL